MIDNALGGARRIRSEYSRAGFDPSEEKKNPRRFLSAVGFSMPKRK